MMDAGVQRLCLWATVLCVVVAVIGFVGFANMIPLPSPNASAAQVFLRRGNWSFPRARISRSLLAISTVPFVPIPASSRFRLWIDDAVVLVKIRRIGQRGARRSRAIASSVRDGSTQESRRVVVSTLYRRLPTTRQPCQRECA